MNKTKIRRVGFRAKTSNILNRKRAKSRVKLATKLKPKSKKR